MCIFVSRKNINIKCYEYDIILCFTIFDNCFVIFHYVLTMFERFYIYYVCWNNMFLFIMFECVIYWDCLRQYLIILQYFTMFHNYFIIFDNISMFYWFYYIPPRFYYIWQLCYFVLLYFMYIISKVFSRYGLEIVYSWMVASQK